MQPVPAVVTPEPVVVAASVPETPVVAPVAVEPVATVQQLHIY